MSFRTYAPNPTLQRLRIISTNGRDQVFIPTPMADYIPLSADSLHDAYEEHAISGYGSLTAPHSFATATHDPTRIRQSKRSSVAGASKSSTTRSSENSNALPDSQHPKAEPQPPASHEDRTGMGNASPSSSSSRPPTPLDDCASTSNTLLTGRPIYVTDEAVEDAEAESAVILKAKWERFSRATPRRLSPSQDGKDVQAGK